MTWLVLGLGVLGAAAVPAEAVPPAALRPALERLAERALLHKRLLFEMFCIEDVTRVVHRSRESAVGFGSQPDQILELRHGLVLVRDQDQQPVEQRVRIDRHGKVRLDRNQHPVVVKLPGSLEPIAQAFPHAQVSSFTAEDQARLDFRVLTLPQADRFLVDCPDPRELAVEFVDRQPPRREGPPSEPRCAARTSGQMCLGPDGEISKIALYGVYPDGAGCRWHRATPFATIEQGSMESSTGLRFPSLVRTLFALSWRDTAVFTQRYQDCVFTRVRVRTTLDE